MRDPPSDIFISYAHNDNRGSDWVSAFVRQLGFAVTRRLGRAPKIFFDDGRLTGNESEAVFEREAAAARLFVPILSPSFVQNAWPVRELAAFVGVSAQQIDRVYPVELLPVPEPQIPPSLRQKIRKHKFWHTLPEAGSDIEIQLDPLADVRAFTLRVEELSARLCQHLLLLDRPAIIPEPQAGQVRAAQTGTGQTGTGQTGTGQTGTGQTVPLPPPSVETKAPAVFLGQVTIDLEDEAFRLRTYLEQFGFRVLPDDTLPQGGADFAAAVQEAVSEARLFVQLLGPHADRRPKDLPEGYTRHQVDAARVAGLPVLQWCRPDLAAETRAQHRDAELFASADLVACGIEEFKSAVVERMQALTRPVVVSDRRTQRALSEQIFIDSDRVDLELARAIADDLLRRSASVYLPVFDGQPDEIAQDRKDSLADCTGIVIVFGAAPPTWVRGQLRSLERAVYGNPEVGNKVVAVYLHPPREKEEVGVMSPNIVWIDGNRPGPGEALTRALTRAPAGASA